MKIHVVSANANIAITAITNLNSDCPCCAIRRKNITSRMSGTPYSVDGHNAIQINLEPSSDAQKNESNSLHI